jgi:hypothetical protein
VSLNNGLHSGVSNPNEVALRVWRGSQVVRPRFARSRFAGSIPAPALNGFTSQKCSSDKSGKTARQDLSADRLSADRDVQKENRRFGSMPPLSWRLSEIINLGAAPACKPGLRPRIFSTLPVSYRSLRLLSNGARIESLVCQAKHS